MIRIRSETITHGQRYLLDLLDNRTFLAFTEKYRLSFTYMHKVAAGIHTPPCDTIYTLRTLIHPDCWFYEEHEALPQGAGYKPTRKKEWNGQDSLGMKLFLELTAGGIRPWAEENGLPYFTVWSITDKNRQVSYNKIAMLKDYIDPASWFFYEYA
jgi:hypothetical protein